MNSNAQAEPEGFAGQMFGASLSDLIQMLCLTMASRAVRVDANAVTGHIFFAGGQIIHATVGVLVGEAALFEMLRWKNGTFTYEESTRAPEETISRHWQSILLEAAQRQDEQSKGSESGEQPNYPAVVSLPGPFMTKHPIEELRTDPDILSFIQSDTEGTLLECKGEDPESLQAGFAYVSELFQLIGSSLGLENLREIHLLGKNQKAICLLQEGMTTAVVTTSKANLTTLSKKLS